MNQQIEKARFYIKIQTFDPKTNTFSLRSDLGDGDFITIRSNGIFTCHMPKYPEVKPQHEYITTISLIRQTCYKSNDQQQVLATAFISESDIKIGETIIHDAVSPYDPNQTQFDVRVYTDPLKRGKIIKRIDVCLPHDLYEKIISCVELGV